MGRKKAVFRGAWYPESKAECESHIKGYLKDNNGILKGNFKGGIVPHAGWLYSGSIACRTIGSIANSIDHGHDIDCIVVFGLHLRSDDPPIILESGTCETPLGDINIEKNLGSAIVEKAMADKIKIWKKSYRSFPEENTIELQLPFIKYFFPDVPVIPIGVPPNQDAMKIGKAVYNAAKDNGLEIVVIGSTDLTHYGQSFGFAPVGHGDKAYEWVKNKNDASAVKALLSMDGEEIVKTGTTNHNMCCSGAAAAAATVSKLLNATKGVKVEYASSYSQSSRDNFVGYAGILFAS